LFIIPQTATAVKHSLTQSVTSDGFYQIEDVFPRVDDGAFPVKRIVGEAVEVWADIYRDGHEITSAALAWRLEADQDWQRVPMTREANDRWGGTFTPAVPGRYIYTIEAWTDEFETWRHGYELKRKAGSDRPLDAIEGAALLTKAQAGSRDASAVIIAACQEFLKNGRAEPLLSHELQSAMQEGQRRLDLTTSKNFPLTVDRHRARFGSWYEMVPRSQGKNPGIHGTFRDCIARLPDVAAMGFDVLYFTPIHPIGKKNRKGRNNAVSAEEGDPGSPYAIGSPAGGHDAIHPELGTLDDFRDLIEACHQHGMEVALDFAVQCSLDHPWARWLDTLCGESSEKVRGHRQPGFPMRGCWLALERIARCGPILGEAGREDFSRRQSPYQAVALLAVVD
jgi:starch synthase (maltosyl-transferring)